MGWDGPELPVRAAALRVRAAGCAGNVALGEVVSGRLWSKAFFAGSRLQNLSDAASIWD